MNWIKENIFATVVLVITVLGSGALLFLATQAKGKLAAAEEQFNTAKGEYDGLIKQPIFPNNKNLEAVKAQHEAYKVKAGELKAELAKMQLPLAVGMTSSQFKAKLNEQVNAAKTKATERHVTLPEDAKFFLGFPAYVNDLPKDAAVPELDLELNCINEVVNKLLDQPISSIEEVKREPLAAESSAAPAPAPTPASGSGASASRRNQPVAPALVQRNTFAIAFTAEQSKVQGFLNSMLSTSQLMTVQLISVENEQTKGPARIAAAAPAPVSPDEAAPDPALDPAIGTPAAPEAPAINVVLGEEKVKVLVRFQIIRLATPPAKS